MLFPSSQSSNLSSGALKFLKFKTDLLKVVTIYYFWFALLMRVELVAEMYPKVTPIQLLEKK